MNPAYDIVDRDPRAVASLRDLLNRTSARTRTIPVPLRDLVPRTYDLAYFQATYQNQTTHGLAIEQWREAGRANAAGASNVAYGVNRLVAVPFVVNAPFLIDTIAFRVLTAGSAGSKARIGIYDSIDDQYGKPYPGTLLSYGSEVDTTGTGVKSATVSLSAEPGHVYWMAYWCGTAAPVIRSIPSAGMAAFPGTDSAMPTTPYWGVYASLTYSSGGLPSAFPSGSSMLAESGPQAPALCYRQNENPSWSRTTYHHAYLPREAGWKLRAAVLVPGSDLTDRSTSVRVDAGLLLEDEFTEIGEPFNSLNDTLRSRAEFDLVTEDVVVPVGTRLVARVQQSGWPAVSLDDACVEFHLGYEGGD